MKRSFGIIVIVFLTVFVNSQQMVTLDLCHQEAVKNYPLAKQNDLIDTRYDLKIASLNKNYFPQLNINGQVHYQSDVTKVPVQDIPAFGIQPLEKDWYKIQLDVNQLIYDGSATSRQKQVEEVNTRIDKKNVEIELYRLKQRINQVYFSIILHGEQIKILELHRNTLNSRLEEVRSGVQNGTTLASNEDILKAEVIYIEQAIEETKILRRSAITILNEYTNLNCTESTDYKIPEIEVNLNDYINNRPEYELFKIQKQKIEVSRKTLGVSNLPKLSAFGQAGYGRPGYDMLKNKFDDYYMIGARLSWKIWDWNHTRKEKEILDLQSKIISTNMETFDKNLRIDLEEKLVNIRKTELKIERDLEIIQLREQIVKAYSSQLENGVITSSEYLNELNAESKAKLEHVVHKVELVKAKLEYQTSIGNL